jgi:hypothetical protein
MMFRAFFASVCLGLSIQTLLIAADVDHVKEAPVNGITLPYTLISPAAVLNRPVVIASPASAVLTSQATAVLTIQASAVSANLRKKEDVEQVDVEGV